MLGGGRFLCQLLHPRLTGPDPELRGPILQFRLANIISLVFVISVMVQGSCATDRIVLVPQSHLPDDHNEVVGKFVCHQTRDAVFPRGHDCRKAHRR